MNTKRRVSCSKIFCIYAEYGSNFRVVDGLRMASKTLQRRTAPSGRQAARPTCAPSSSLQEQIAFNVDQKSQAVCRESTIFVHLAQAARPITRRAARIRSR